MNLSHTSETPRVKNHSHPVAFVTGGSGGIGTAICNALHKTGHRVIAGYYNHGDPSKAKAWQRSQHDAGIDIDIAYIDVKDFDSCQKCILNIQETVGPVEVLINNAGITQDVTLKNMSQTQWHQVIDTNLTSVFNISKAVLTGMLDKQWGRIINISSINAHSGQFGQVNYAASKAGMHGFTKSLALEVAKKGITVNTVSPGYIETDMITHMPLRIKEALVHNIPVGRFGHPEEIGRIVAFLADHESGFITGADFSVNGGHHMY